MNSIVVHYQEIALKGKNRPWFLARLVRNLRAALSDLDVRAVRPLMGRIEVVLGPSARADEVGDRLRHVFGIANFSYAGRSMQWVFDKRAIFGEAASHLSLVSSGAEEIVARGNQELIDLAMREVTEALPQARTANLTRAVVVREKRATFSVAPGQPPRPKTRTELPGLFLAGDWIDTGLPATIEGAVLSGHLAAAAIQ